MTREDTIKLLKKEEAKMAHLRTDMAETMCLAAPTIRWYPMHPASHTKFMAWP